MVCVSMNFFLRFGRLTCFTYLYLLNSLAGPPSIHSKSSSINSWSDGGRRPPRFVETLMSPLPN